MVLRLILAVCFLFAWGPSPLGAAENASEKVIREEISRHAVPLDGAGKTLLLNEARTHDYFLLGELHGEMEIPELLGDLWPDLWSAGYRHVAAEVSPWAANQLRQRESATAPVVGTWTRAEADLVNKLAAPNENVLWGCDIEEIGVQGLIQDLGKMNPADAQLRQMNEIVAQGYSRKLAKELLSLAKSAHPAHDRVVGGESLWRDLQDTLRVEALRADPDSRFYASEARERLMKDLFLEHRGQEPQGKVMLRFGRNHLHRGYDARGISTLGNFVSEWALAQHQSVFNVGVFAAGGQERLLGKTFDADERQDELGFDFLANLAGSQATLFDLRPIRSMLHAIPQNQRTGLEANLVYWADSYDFLLCYPVVSPLGDAPASKPH